MRSRAIFIDKDGTLIEDKPFNVDPGAIEFAPGAFEAMRRLKNLGYRLIVITNQAGVALGYFGIEDVHGVFRELQFRAREEGVVFDGFYFCPHHPEGSVPEFAIRCGCRKPEPGMIMEAARDHEVDLEQSWFIGDILNDVEAGSRAGCRTVLIVNGNETEWRTGPGRSPSVATTSLAEAADAIFAYEHGAFDSAERTNTC